MRVALIHDSLTTYGGAERVLEVFAELFPEAPILVPIYRKGLLPHLEHRISPSFLQNIPGVVKHHTWTAPLLPLAIEYVDTSGYDLVISSASAYAKGVRTNPPTIHICYCHTPTRYLWSDAATYRSERRLSPVKALLFPLVTSFLRRWDKRAAQRPDLFVANSHHVAQRIQTYYGRTSRVIEPPIEIPPTPTLPMSARTGAILTGGRLVGYKHFDLVLEAAKKLNTRVVLFGDGPERERLLALGADVDYRGFVTDKELVELYRSASVFVHPCEEDFGLTIVEAMSHGTPVVALDRGGAKETVQPGVNGEFFGELNAEDLSLCLKKTFQKEWNTEAIRDSVRPLDVSRFRERFQALIHTHLKHSL